ncbi:MAG TPA: N-methyl-L-tryptophan oxidase [Steroidobacteraceae bacterium]|nr:N-methyl-L-tryptophan oxidase [Steroidobacteraceae bacterium]
MTRQAAYDVVVLGVGAMGSAACHHLARRGRRVLGIEHFGIAHARGSSHGVNRIIRLAYHEHESYVPLVRRAYELWRELEQQSGAHLLHLTGSVDASTAEDAIAAGALRVCTRFGIDHELYTGAELSLRFPGLQLPADHVALYQPEGGFLASERCIETHVRCARDAGAEIHEHERVLGWDVTSAGVRVRSDSDEYLADRLIVAAGAWLGELVPGLASLARPERQVLGWFDPIVPEHYAHGRFPVFNVAVEEGRFYGTPVFGVPGFKVGRYHHLGEQIETPDDWDREPNADDEAALREFVERYCPDAAGALLAAKTCMFTNTPDEHFIIDTLPAEPRVVVASPCSGHGFKFSAVVGEILADLVTDGTTRHDIGLFRLSRFDRSAAPGGGGSYFQPPPSAR